MNPNTVIQAIKTTATVLGVVVTLAKTTAELIGQVAETMNANG